MLRALGFQQPFWLVGFRPLFAVAMAAGIFYPLLWALVYAGVLPVPPGFTSPFQWHAHEMLFGFGWAVMGGFLLTASKNWVGTRGIHGRLLAFCTFLWVVERAAVAFLPPTLPHLVRVLGSNVFVIFVAGYVMTTLLIHHKSDKFRDNFFFLLALPLFLVAKVLLLNDSTFAIGWAMSLGLFRLAFAVMFERTMTQFVRGSSGRDLLRDARLDYAIKFLLLAGIFEAVWPAPIAASILAAAGTLFLIRLFAWSPLQGMKSFGVAVMYVGSFGLGVSLLLQALRIAGVYSGLGSLAPHVFTFGCMGIVIPSMMIRICQGHTGRPIRFATSDKAAIGCMGVACLARLLLTQVAPSYYGHWISLSALAWSACFVLIAVRLVPFLFQPRVDGREH